MSKEGEGLELSGVAAVITNPDGHVVANCADFDRQGYGGVGLEASQRIRVTRSVKKRFAENHLNAWMANDISTVFAEDFWEHAAKVGYRLHIFPVSTAPQGEG